MFAVRFFTNRLFPNRFFPHVGGVPVPPTPSTTGILFFDANTLPVFYADEPLPLGYDDGTLELYYQETELKPTIAEVTLPVRFTRGNR